MKEAQRRFNKMSPKLYEVGWEIVPTRIKYIHE